MTNFEKVMEAARKANEEITKLEARNAEIRKEIAANKEARLKEFEGKMKHIVDAFYENVKNFLPCTTLFLNTGLTSKENKQIFIRIHKPENNRIVSICEKNKCYCNLYDYEYVKDNGYADVLDAILDCADSVVEKAEESFIQQLSEKIDQRFIEAATVNDGLIENWEREFASNKPFHVDEWTDRDIIKALETAGKPATKENIDRLKEAVLDFLQYDVTEYKTETLLELMTEVFA